VCIVEMNTIVGPFSFGSLRVVQVQLLCIKQQAEKWNKIDLSTLHTLLSESCFADVMMTIKTVLVL